MNKTVIKIFLEQDERGNVYIDYGTQNKQKGKHLHWKSELTLPEETSLIYRLLAGTIEGYRDMRTKGNTINFKEKIKTDQARQHIDKMLFELDMTGNTEVVKQQLETLKQRLL